MTPKFATRSSTIRKECGNVDELVWTPVSPLRAALVPGRHGSESVPPGIVLVEITGFSLVQVMARRAGWTRLAKAAKKCFGVVPPSQPRAVKIKNGVLIWSGPDQFLVLGNETMRDEITSHFGGLASLSEQGDGRVMLAVTGAKARHMLAKVYSLDLHPQAFEVGAAAATSIEHINVNLWRSADNADGYPVFHILLPSSFAASLWETLVGSSAEFGVAVKSKNFSP
jgi:methylglutamate dehydrogenase subunit D